MSSQCHHRLILALLLLASAGCSSFQRDWEHAGKFSVAPDTPTRWDGRWMSERNGHNGKLRCLLTPQENDIYAARFRARYFKIFSFEYTVPLQMIPMTNGWKFIGSENLSLLAGGVYHYAGTIVGTNFYSTYRASVDHGFFEMTQIDPD